MSKQMINDEAAANLKGSTEAAAQVLENATIFMFIGQILLKGVLKKLMGALVLLQVIIHNMMLKPPTMTHIIFGILQSFWIIPCF